MKTQDTYTKPPPIPLRIWKIAAVIGAGAFIVMLDSTVVNLALESIRDDFGARLTLVQWVASAYLVALAVSLPASAWLGSRYGYSRVYQWSLAGFTIGSALCALAPDTLSLIAARVLQGLAGGIMIPTGHAVNGAVCDRRQLGRVIGTLGILIAIGPAFGPVVGGWIMEASSWRWLFWLNVPVGILTLWGGRLVLPKAAEGERRTLDKRGLILVGTGLPLVLFGLTELGAEGMSAVSLAAALLGFVLLIAFVLTSHRTAHPILDLRLLKRPVFAACMATVTVTGINMFGGLLVLPLYFQIISGETVAGTGMLLLWMGLGSMVALPIAGQLIDRFGAGPVCIGGALVLTLSMVPFAVMDSLPAWLVAPALLSRGIGMALAQMPAMAAAYASVSVAEMGDAASLLNIVQRTGGAVGAVGMVVLLAQLGNNLSGYQATFYTMMLAAAVALALALYLHHHAKRERETARVGSG